MMRAVDHSFTTIHHHSPPFIIISPPFTTNVMSAVCGQEMAYLCGRLVKVDIFMVRLSYQGTDDIDLKNDARFVISDHQDPLGHIF